MATMILAMGDQKRCCRRDGGLTTFSIAVLWIASTLTWQPCVADVIDPTRPDYFVEDSGDQEGGSESIDLSLIFVSGKVSYAVVNGKLVKEKDPVAGGSVLSIEKNKVVIERNGKSIELTLVANVIMSKPVSENRID